MGIEPGTLNLSSPAVVVSGLGGMGGSYDGVEVFSDEIATLLSDHCVYRESSYQVYLPYDSTFIPKMLGHVRSVTCSQSADPWGYLRTQISVSYPKNNFSFGYFWLKFCF